MTENNQTELREPLPSIAQWLGYLGLIPFVVLSLGNATGVDMPWFGLISPLQALLFYAAIIITFIGAVHWGIALGATASTANSHYLYSVIPSLFAWGILFLPLKAALFGMALTLVALYIIDRWLLKGVQNTSYLTLRLHLTIVAGLSMAIAGFTANW